MHDERYDRPDPLLGDLPPASRSSRRARRAAIPEDERRWLESLSEQRGPSRSRPGWRESRVDPAWGEPGFQERGFQERGFHERGPVPPAAAWEPAPAVRPRGDRPRYATRAERVAAERRAEELAARAAALEAAALEAAALEAAPPASAPRPARPGVTSPGPLSGGVPLRSRGHEPGPSRRELRGRPPAPPPVPVATPPDQLPVTQPRGLPSAFPAATTPAPLGVTSGGVAGVPPRSRREDHYDSYADELLTGRGGRRGGAGATRASQAYVPAARDGRRGRGDPEESAALRRKALLAAGLLATLLSSVYIVNERDARAAEEPPLPAPTGVQTPGAQTPGAQDPAVQDPAVQNPAVQDPGTDGGTVEPVTP